MTRDERVREIASELVVDLRTSLPVVSLARYTEWLEFERDRLKQAATNALVYLQNAQTEEFARGSDKAVRVELAEALGVEVE